MTMRKITHGKGFDTEDRKNAVQKPEEKSGLYSSQALVEKLMEPVTWLELKGLSRRVAGRVHSEMGLHGIKTLGDLVRKSDDDLQGMRFLRGEKVRKELKKELKKLGLSLDRLTLVDRLRMPVASLELSTRANNVFSNNGVMAIHQLVVLPESELLKMKNFGRKTMKEVKSRLSEAGLSLGMRLDDKTLSQVQPAKPKSPPAPKAASPSAMGDGELIAFAKRMIESNGIKTASEFRKNEEGIYVQLRKRRLLDKIGFQSLISESRDKGNDEILANARKVINERMTGGKIKIDAKAPKSEGVGMQGGKIKVLEDASKEKSAPERRHSISVQEGTALTTKMKPIDLQLLIDEGKAELDALLEVVRPEAVSAIKMILRLFKFPGESNGGGQMGGSRSLDINPGESE